MSAWYAMRARWGLVARWWCIRATVIVVLVLVELNQQRLVLFFARLRVRVPTS